MDYKELWDDISTNAYALGLDELEKRIEGFINERVKIELEALAREIVNDPWLPDQKGGYITVERIKHIFKKRGIKP